MSYIDSYKHEHVGLFGGLPVYHPLEDIPGSDSPGFEDEFACATDQIVIGGGDGEWPGLVIKSPVGAAVTFLDCCFDEADLFKMIEKSAWEEIIDKYRYKENRFKFCGWGVAHYHDFYERCKSPAMSSAFQESSDVGSFEAQSFEDWLACSVGEFIFFAMPELAPALMAKLKDPYRGAANMGFNNILIVPPNMPVFAFAGNAWEITRKTQP